MKKITISKKTYKKLKKEIDREENRQRAIRKNKGWIEKKYYLHSNKESNYVYAETWGMEEDAQKYFSYAFSEVELSIKVNLKTGEYKILAIDGKKLIFYKEENEKKRN